MTVSSPEEREAVQQGSNAKHRAISREIYLPVLKAFLLLNQSQAVSKQGWGFTRNHKSFPFASRRKNGRNRHDIPEGILYQNENGTQVTWETGRGQGVATRSQGARQEESVRARVWSEHRSTFGSISQPRNEEEGHAKDTRKCPEGTKHIVCISFHGVRLLNCSLSRGLSFPTCELEEFRLDSI